MQYSFRLIAFLLLFSASKLMAQSLSQQVIASTGSFSQSSGFSLSSTTGEAIVQTLGAVNDILLTQGFQQSFDFTTTIDGKILTQQFYLFPNPCDQQISIKVPEIFQNKSLQIALFDITGKLIQTVEFEHSFQNEFTFNMSKQAMGLYVIQLNCPELSIYTHVKFLKSTTN